MSALFRDRPRSPREETVYWVEYVIRHGKNALRSPAVDIPWWQVELLDVYAFIGFGVLATLALAILLLSKLARLGLSLLLGRTSGSDGKRSLLNGNSCNSNSTNSSNSKNSKKRN